MSIGASAQSWTSGATVQNGDYYLYNIGAKRFISRGADWDTHATVDGAGLVVSVGGTSGAYTIHFPGTNNDQFLSNEGWIDANLDRWDGTTYNFESANCTGYSGVYKLKANKGGNYLQWAGGGKDKGGNNANVGGFPSTELNGYWLLIPKSDREQTSGASANNPLDVTFLINNPDFERNSFALGWNKGGFWAQTSQQSFTNATFA